MILLADTIRRRGGNVNRILSTPTPGGVDVHQPDCTFYSALGEDDDRYVAARAIQLFARGVPQLYYVGLLAGDNDHAAVERTGEGRAINRHDYTAAEIDAALERPSSAASSSLPGCVRPIPLSAETSTSARRVPDRSASGGHGPTTCVSSTWISQTNRTAVVSVAARACTS